MIDESELYDALDELLASEKDLRRQRRALYPAVLRRRKATTRVLAVWRARKGDPAAPPDAGRPILDAIDSAPMRQTHLAESTHIIRGVAPAPAVTEEVPDPTELGAVEERPDGSPGRPAVATVVSAPPQGWGAGTLGHGAELILGPHPDREELADLLVCDKAWCRALRYCPRAERTGSRCPVCHGKKARAYLTVLTELEAQPPRTGIDLVTSRPDSTPTANGHPELEPAVTMGEKPPKRAPKKRKEKAPS